MLHTWCCRVGETNGSAEALQSLPQEQSSTRCIGIQNPRGSPTLGALVDAIERATSQRLARFPYAQWRDLVIATPTVPLAALASALGPASFPFRQGRALRCDNLSMLPPTTADPLEFVRWTLSSQRDNSPT
mmetsp:Transcript_41365/g.96906  ORF Transcript_41365/g.96906 Transcript_41365/m.96906 type:complete len:131 (-) Transcript_41365:992-1384(-)